MITKKKPLNLLLAIIVCFLLWRLSLCLGIIRAIPQEWLDYSHDYSLNSDSVSLPSSDVRCPLCHKHVVALYGSMIEDNSRRGIYTDEGYPVWKWTGCIQDAFWECQGCGKRFNMEGKAITLLTSSNKKLAYKLLQTNSGAQ